jgi:hypothetical protein
MSMCRKMFFIMKECQTTTTNFTRNDRIVSTRWGDAWSCETRWRARGCGGCMSCLFCFFNPFSIIRIIVWWVRRVNDLIIVVIMLLLLFVVIFIATFIWIYVLLLIMLFLIITVTVWLLCLVVCICSFTFCFGCQLFSWFHSTSCSTSCFFRTMEQHERCCKHFLQIYVKQEHDEMEWYEMRWWHDQLCTITKIRTKKNGHINTTTPRIFDRMGNDDCWMWNGIEQCEWRDDTINTVRSQGYEQRRTDTRSNEATKREREEMSVVEMNVMYNVDTHDPKRKKAPDVR